MPRFRQVPQILKVMSQKDLIRNIGLVAHIDHGKTSTIDSLLAAAGLLPPEVAGKAKALDFLKEEQKRGITIKTANISLLHSANGQNYVINLIDTPGHVDFTGKVTRALRAIDSAIIVVDAVEEIMAQTETVTRQALQERVKPLLFINKVDRLINELKLSADEIQRKFIRIISEFNSLVEVYAEPEFGKRWKVSPSKETVVFGSALHRWGFTAGIAQNKGIDFADILDAYQSERRETVASRLPLSQAILDAVVRNCPSPLEAQKYRIPKIWGGTLDSEVGRAMVRCDENGPAVACITDIKLNQKEDVVITARLFSGSIKEGDLVYLVNADKELIVKQVFLYMSAFLERTSKVSAGNIAALTGLNDAKAGETVIHTKFKEDATAFEALRYISEPVITVAVEPEKPADLPRLAEALKKLMIEDANLALKFNQKTGEYLLSGMGELHLETAQTSLREHLGEVEITTSEPAVDYRETIVTEGSAVTVKSVDKQSSLCVKVKPLGDKEFEAIVCNEPHNLWRWDDCKNVLTRPISRVELTCQVKEAIIGGFHWACKTGPLCEQPLKNVKVELLNVQVQEDASVCEPFQVERALGRAILGSVLTARPVILEPVYLVEVSTPSQWFGTCTNIIAARRGKVVAADNRGMLTIITCTIPVAESFGLTSELRSATSGRAFWQGAHTDWQRMSEKIAAETIRKIRGRKGLPLEVPKPEKFVDKNMASWE